MRSPFPRGGTKGFPPPPVPNVWTIRRPPPHNSGALRAIWSWLCGLMFLMTSGRQVEASAHQGRDACKAHLSLAAASPLLCGVMAAGASMAFTLFLNEAAVETKHSLRRPEDTLLKAQCLAARL